MNPCSTSTENSGSDASARGATGDSPPDAHASAVLGATEGRLGPEWHSVRRALDPLELPLGPFLTRVRRNHSARSRHNKVVEGAVKWLDRDTGTSPEDARSAGQSS